MSRNLGGVIRRIAVVLVLFLSTASAGICCDGSPLILDLNGDGVQTTSTTWPVQFDINGNGTVETIAWTNPDTQEGILWLDRNGDGVVTNGQELFGDATLLADGTRSNNGFLALGEWDKRVLGGNADGRLTDADRVWRALRVWIDANHNGAADEGEVQTLNELGVVALRLGFIRSSEVDANGNYHYWQGYYERRVKLPDNREGRAVLAMQDIYFHIAD